MICKYVNRDTGHKREYNRIYATDIFKIKKGYLKPKDFFTKEPIEDNTALNLITKGIAMEDFLLKVFTELKAPIKHHHKLEYTFEDVTISGEIDFLFPDKMVIETKFPKEPLTELPERYKDQCEFYHRVTGLPVYLGEFPYPMKLWPYIPDDTRWEEDKKIAYDFCKKVEKLIPAKTSTETSTERLIELIRADTGPIFNTYPSNVGIISTNTRRRSHRWPI